VLVACEFSARVRDAFRARGHDAYSVDLLPTEGDPRWHWQDDALRLLRHPWDMLIAFPPCTDLSNAGSQLWAQKRADGRQDRAARFFMRFVEADHVALRAIENPQGVMSNLYRKPDQYVHPFHFGEPIMKRTGLWLYGLPVLRHTNVVEPVGYHVSSSCRADKPHMRTRGVRDPAARSRISIAIANAMAEQWG
jgi:hypothetical protein